MVNNFKSFVFELYKLKGKTKKKFKKIFNRSKREHSKRVHKYVLEFGINKHLEQAALFHDFIEEGGKKDFLKHNVSKKAYKLIKVLTHKSDKSTLKSLKHHFEYLSNEDLIDAIKLKLADRAANFNQRIEDNELTEKYINKTANLLTYLYSMYPANSDNIEKFIASHFINTSSTLGRRLKLF